MANVVVCPHPLGLECLLPSPRASPRATGAFSWQMQDSRALGSWHALALLPLAKADWEEIMKALLPNHPVPAKCPYLRCYLHSRTPSRIRQGIGHGLKSHLHMDLNSRTRNLNASPAITITCRPLTHWVSGLPNNGHVNSLHIGGYR